MKTIFNAIQKWYYYPELKTIFSIVSAITLVYTFYMYGSLLASFLFTQQGFTYLAFFMMAIVLGIVIKIYYRILIIKYTEKDSGKLRLFQENE